MERTFMWDSGALIVRSEIPDKGVPSPNGGGEQPSGIRRHPDAAHVACYPPVPLVRAEVTATVV
jgi:hypothetical protein